MLTGFQPMSCLPFSAWQKYDDNDDDDDDDDASFCDILSFWPNQNQDGEEDWPLQILDNHGNSHEVFSLQNYYKS